MNWHRIMSRNTFAATGGLILFVLAACQPSGPKSVSLDEAKQATASFGTEGFAAPPRRASDILALLEEAKTDEVRVAQLRAQASAQPPAGASDRVLARFYSERSFAAKKVGLLQQYVADQEEAYRHAKAGYGGEAIWADNRDYVRQTAYAQRLYGNNDRAEELFAEDRRLSAKYPKALFSSLGNLVGTRAWGGKTVEAEQYLREFEALYPRIRGRDKWTSYLWNDAHSGYLTSVGRFDEAQEYFTPFMELIPELEEDADNMETTMYMRVQYAKFLLRAGRPLEAELQARDALKAALRYSVAPTASVAFPASVLADALADEGRLDEATILARRVIDLLTAGGATPEMAVLRNAQRSLALLLAAQGDWAESRALFDAVARTGKSDATLWIDDWMRLSAVYPMVMIETGSLAEATAKLRDSQATMEARFGERHPITAEFGGVLAVALTKSGAQKEAMELFRSSVPILISRSREIQKGGGTATAGERMLDYILASYLRLLIDLRGTTIESASGLNAVEEAFQIADLARSRAVQQAIGASAARAAASDRDLADLARREQDARGQISSLYDLIASAPDEASAKDLKGRIDTLRSARAALMEEIERRYPDYAALINPKPLSLAEARSLLHPGEALVSLYAGPEESYVWAASADNVAFERVALNAADIDDRVKNLRKALNPAARTLGEIPSFDVAAAHELYRAILEPVSAAWKSADTLVVVPHGALAQLPLALLPTDVAQVDEDAEPLFSGYRAVPWLARDHAVVTVPSVSAFAALRRLPSPNQARTQLAAFGDPIFTPNDTEAGQPNADAPLASRGLLAVRGLPVKLRAAPGTEASASAQLPMLPRLPETADEVRGIAVALSADPATSVFLGADASEQRVKTMDLAGRRVVVFATHGLVSGDLDGLTQPALALSNPALSKDGGDGLLTMGEILALKLDADWVVLSACNTAAGEGAGSEAISGLGRAFLYAGARALLVSNWPVETTSTRALTTDIFNRQAEDPALTRASALRQAMLGLIDGPGYVDATGSVVFSYAHPIFWAPFALVGDGA